MAARPAVIERAVFGRLGVDRHADVHVAAVAVHVGEPPGVHLGALGRIRVNAAGVAQKLGQLEAIRRDLQSKYWGQLAAFGPTL